MNPSTLADYVDIQYSRTDLRYSTSDTHYSIVYFFRLLLLLSKVSWALGKKDYVGAVDVALEQRHLLRRHDFQVHLFVRSFNGVRLFCVLWFSLVFVSFLCGFVAVGGSEKEQLRRDKYS